jgi:hypothetical protein
MAAPSKTHCRLPAATTLPGDSIASLSSSNSLYLHQHPTKAHNVGGYEILKGIKHTVLFHKQKACIYC